MRRLGRHLGRFLAFWSTAATAALPPHLSLPSGPPTCLHVFAAAHLSPPLGLCDRQVPGCGARRKEDDVCEVIYRERCRWIHSLSLETLMFLCVWLTVLVSGVHAGVI